MEPGQFSLDLQLSRKGAEPVRLRGYSPSRLMVRDTATEHKFAVKVSSRRFAQTLKQLGVEPAPSKKKPTPKKK
jgi:hypothetical protein